MNRFHLLLLNAQGEPRWHSSHATVEQALEQTKTAPAVDQGWRILDVETGLVVEAGHGKVVEEKMAQEKGTKKPAKKPVKKAARKKPSRPKSKSKKRKKRK